MCICTFLRTMTIMCVYIYTYIHLCVYIFFQCRCTKPLEKSEFDFTSSDDETYGVTQTSQQKTRGKQDYHHKQISLPETNIFAPEKMDVWNTIDSFLLGPGLFFMRLLAVSFRECNRKQQDSQAMGPMFLVVPWDGHVDTWRTGGLWRVGMREVAG